MRNRRRYEFEIVQIVLSVVIIVLTAILFVKSQKLTILYPLIFGCGAVLSALYALEGILYNRNRLVKKSRLIIFGIIAAILILFTVLSAVTISK